VPKTISIPTNVGFTNSTFTLYRAVAMSGSPFSGAQRTQEYDAVYWTGRATLPPMKRSDAVEWQSFFLDLEGMKNNFIFGDPDAKTPQGTFNGGYLRGETRIDSGSQVTSVTLSFSGSTITAGTAIFDGLVVGDFFTVSGALKEENNGTFKITTKTSDTVVVVDHSLTTESSTASCQVRQNVKGSTALSLRASGDSGTGTIKKGDYLGIYDSGAPANGSPVQLVMATADAVFSVESGPDHYSVPIQPKLRANLGSNAVGFSSLYNKSRFRLTTNEVQWDTNAVSNFGFTFEFMEVI